MSERMEAIGWFSSSMTHDLNNLLMVILGASERLQARLPPNDPLQKDSQAIHASALRAVAIAQQVLALTRQRPQASEVFSLGGLVADSLEVLRRMAGSLVTIGSRRTGGADTVLGDRTQIEQVLLNLVANARDAMPNGGMIEIATGLLEVTDAPVPGWRLPRGRYVTLGVTDTGVGMTPEAQARAFEPLFTTKTGKGTGLGLHTVRRLVEQCGGAVHIESAQGAGTTVRVFLPLAAGEVAASAPGSAAAAGTPAAPAASPAAKQVGGATVLVVEDEDAVRELVVEMLESAGHTVIGVSRPTLAIEACRAAGGAIDLLLTDIVMPDMSGLELARRVRTMQPRVQLLYMSGYADHTDLPGGALEEDMRLIAKPFDTSTLLRSVREALEAADTGQS